MLALANFIESEKRHLRSSTLGAGILTMTMKQEKEHRNRVEMNE